MSHASPTSDAAPEQKKLRALLIEFASEKALLTAVRRVREAGYTKFDAHSPYPVHGIEAAAGIRMTRLAWIVFGLGVIGAITGLILQWWTNAAAPTTLGDFVNRNIPDWTQGYRFHVSGKPFFSLPANIPVIFELTVLLAAFGAVFGMLVMNDLPKFYNALFSSRRFARATCDRFFISIEADDAGFDAERTASFAASLDHEGAIERIYDVDTPPPPRALRWIGWILISLLLLPPALAAKARFSFSEEPRIHPIQDMDNQPRYKSQMANPAFRDGRAMRTPPAGVVARGEAPVDAHYAFGYRDVVDEQSGVLTAEYYDGFPPGYDVTLRVIERGRQRFNIYCAPCHGYDGHGQGIVHKRAMALQTAGWRQPTDLHSDSVIERADGHIFNTISAGIRTMPGYGDQIPIDDRWAIVSYVRALQRSSHATLDDVPPEQRSSLR